MTAVIMIRARKRSSEGYGQAGIAAVTLSVARYTLDGVRQLIDYAIEKGSPVIFTTTGGAPWEFDPDDYSMVSVMNDVEQDDE